MCAYSFIADHGRDQLERYRPEPYPVIWPNDAVRVSELERRVADLEELLRKAKEYDEETGQPDCELDEWLAHDISP